MSIRSKNRQPDILQTIVIGFFKLLWWLITLPFKGFSEKKGLNIEERTYIAKKKAEIENLAQSENPIELSHAVMEADKLVDFKLKAMGARGETFADRLRNMENNIPPSTYEKIWQGHKLRNELAHEHKMRTSNAEYREASKKLLDFLKA